MTGATWFEHNTFHHSQFSDLDEIESRKKRQNCKISVGIPTLNEELTIGTEVKMIRSSLMEDRPLVDEIAVIDSGSEDRTREKALSAGALYSLRITDPPDFGLFSCTRLRCSLSNDLERSVNSLKHGVIVVRHA